MLKALLPFLPEPLPFGPLLDGMRRDIRRCKGEGRLVMVGEVGLDGAARVLWPVAGRRLYDETTRTLRADYVERAEGMEQGEGEVGTGAVSRGDTSEGGKGGRDQDNEAAHDVSAPEGEEWKRLSPFKISMDHQKAILRAQMDIAVEFGIPISLHCVAAPGKWGWWCLHVHDIEQGDRGHCKASHSADSRPHNRLSSRDERYPRSEIYEPRERRFAFRWRMDIPILATSFCAS